MARTKVAEKKEKKRKKKKKNEHVQNHIASPTEIANYEGNGSIIMVWSESFNFITMKNTVMFLIAIIHDS